MIWSKFGTDNSRCTHFTTLHQGDTLNTKLLRATLQLGLFKTQNDLRLVPVVLQITPICCLGSSLHFPCPHVLTKTCCHNVHGHTTNTVFFSISITSWGSQPLFDMFNYSTTISISDVVKSQGFQTDSLCSKFSAPTG
jgi:hypothetical protein